MPPTTIMSSALTGAPQQANNTNSSGIFGVPPMPPTSIFNPASAVSQQQTTNAVEANNIQSQFTSTLPPPIWALPSSVAPIPAASVATTTVPTAAQEALAAAFQPTPMTYGAYGQAFTQAYVPVPVSDTPVLTPSPAPPTIQQTPMSIPTYASCPQTTPSQQQSPFGGSQQAAPVPMMMTPSWNPPPQQQPLMSVNPGTTMNTSISLPGMPPLTVSATIPPTQLEGLQFNRQ